MLGLLKDTKHRAHPAGLTHARAEASARKAPPSVLPTSSQALPGKAETTLGRKFLEASLLQMLTTKITFPLLNLSFLRKRQVITACKF